MIDGADNAQQAEDQPPVVDADARAKEGRVNGQASFEVNGVAVNPRDGVAIADLDSITVTANDDAEIILVDVA